MLKRALVLVDARHGLKDVDREIMEMLDEAAVSYHLVLTKADKIKPTALAETLEATKAEAAKHPAAHPLTVRHLERNRRGHRRVTDSDPGGGPSS